MNPEEKTPVFDTQSLEEIIHMMNAAPGESLRSANKTDDPPAEAPEPTAGAKRDAIGGSETRLDDHPAAPQNENAQEAACCEAPCAQEETAAAPAAQKGARRKKTREKKKKEQEKLTPAAEAYSLLHDWVYVLAALTLIFVFFFRLVGVSGSSMYPTFVDRDYLVLQSNFLYSGAKRGDIVVLSVECFADDGPIVKRVIATGGQTVDIDFETGDVFVDGVLQDEPYIFEPTYRSNAEIGESLDYPVVVPEGSVFVMGDNRNHSADSRYAPCGCVPEDQILGKALLLIIPGRQTDEYGQVTGGREFGRIGAIF